MGISLSQPPSPSYPQIETMANLQVGRDLASNYEGGDAQVGAAMDLRRIFGKVAEVWFLCEQSCGQTKRNPIGIDADPKVSFF